MSMLRDRICGQGQPDRHATTVAKDYGTPTMIPLSRVQILGNGIAYDEPLVTSDGAAVSNTGLGQWGQLYAVGRA